MGKDVVAEEMAAGPRTGTTARPAVTTATVASTRPGTHTDATALEARKVYAGEVAATKPRVEVEDRARILAKTTGDVAGVSQFYRACAIDSAASSHMVCTESRISKHVIKPADRRARQRIAWHVKRNKKRYAKI